MNQHQLERIVARRTGESIRCIRRRGFQLIVMPTLPAAPQRQSSPDSSLASARPAKLATSRFAS